MRMKFKGLENEKLPIRASFSEDGKYVICGSEDHEVYIWNASKDGSSVNEKSFVGGKTDRNASFEHFKAHENAATVSIFMPKQAIEFSHIASSNPRKIKQMLISASFDGVIRVFEQRS